MKTVEFHDLPLGAQVRGNLYLDPKTEYWTGDVMQIELPTGYTVDVGWDEDRPDMPFRIAVYREYFGDRFVEYRVGDPDAVVNEVVRLAKHYSQPIVASSCSVTVSKPRPIDRMPQGGTRMVACLATSAATSILKNAG